MCRGRSGGRACMPPRSFPLPPMTGTPTRPPSSLVLVSRTSAGNLPDGGHGLRSNYQRAGPAEPARGSRRLPSLPGCPRPRPQVRRLQQTRHSATRRQPCMHDRNLCPKRSRGADGALIQGLSYRSPTRSSISLPSLPHIKSLRHIAKPAAWTRTDAVPAGLSC
jgi:hypothetical protein